jgi:hypothetical protein
MTLFHAIIWKAEHATNVPSGSSGTTFVVSLWPEALLSLSLESQLESTKAESHWAVYVQALEDNTEGGMGHSLESWSLQALERQVANCSLPGMMHAQAPVAVL